MQSAVEALSNCVKVVPRVGCGRPRSGDPRSSCVPSGHDVSGARRCHAVSSVQTGVREVSVLSLCHHCVRTFNSCLCDYAGLRNFILRSSLISYIIENILSLIFAVIPNIITLIRKVECITIKNIIALTYGCAIVNSKF